MSVQITQVGTDTHPGIFANQRRLGRCENGVLWYLACDPSSSRLEFHYSDDGGVTWHEDTSQRITNVIISSGASMRIGGTKATGERIAVIYHDDGDNRIRVAFGYFDTGARTRFRWHPASPRDVSKERRSVGWRRPDVELMRDGDQWFMPCVWSDHYATPGRGLVYFGRARGFPHELYADSERDLDDEPNVSTFPRPSISLRHMGDPALVNGAAPDAYVFWQQGIDSDPRDRTYGMRLTKSGTTWQAGQERELLDDSIVGDLLASTFTGQRAVAVGPPAGSSSELVLELMQPSDGSREFLSVPSLGLGEITACTVTHDNYAGDVWIIAAATTNKRPHRIIYAWQTRTWGAWSEINTDVVMPTTLSARPGSAGSAIDVSYTVDIGSAMEFRFERIGATNVAPSTPTWASEAGPANVAATLESDWNHNDADGDAQVRYQYRRSVNGGAYTYWNGTSWQSTAVEVATANTVITEAAGWATAGDVLEDYVRTYDGQVWSPWSASLTRRGSTPVNPTITAPPAGTYNAPHVTLEWTVADQSAYRARLIRTLDEGVAHDSGWLGGSTVRAYPFPVDLDNGASYRLELETQNTDGLASTVVTRLITASLLPPPVPSFTITPVAALAVLSVEITNGVAGGGEEAADLNRVWRRLIDPADGVTVIDERVVAETVAVDGAWADRTIGAGQVAHYAVEAFTAAGASIMSAYQA